MSPPSDRESPHGSYFPFLSGLRLWVTSSSSSIRLSPPAVGKACLSFLCLSWCLDPSCGGCPRECVNVAATCVHTCIAHTCTLCAYMPIHTCVHMHHSCLQVFAHIHTCTHINAHLSPHAQHLTCMHIREQCLCTHTPALGWQGSCGGAAGVLGVAKSCSRGALTSAVGRRTHPVAEPHLLEGVRMGVDSIGEKVIFPHCPRWGSMAIWA